MKLSSAMEAGLLAISWQLATRKSLAVLPVKANTRNALEGRGLLMVTVVGSVNGETMWTLTEAGLAEVDRIERERDAENANAIRIAREEGAQHEAPSLPALVAAGTTFVEGRVVLDEAGVPQLLTGDALTAWKLGLYQGREVRGTVGKLCKVKKSSAGHRAKWRKGR